MTELPVLLFRGAVNDRRPNVVKVGHLLEACQAPSGDLFEQPGRPGRKLVGQLGTVEPVKDFERDGVVQYPVLQLHPPGSPERACQTPDRKLQCVALPVATELKPDPPGNQFREMGFRFPGQVAFLPPAVVDEAAPAPPSENEVRIHLVHPFRNADMARRSHQGLMGSDGQQVGYGFDIAREPPGDFNRIEILIR